MSKAPILISFTIEVFFSIHKELGTFPGGIHLEITGQNVTDGVHQFIKGNHDGVIAVGGGSGMDTGKGIAFMAGQERPLWDFEDISFPEIQCGLHRRIFPQSGRCA